ncbi:hypothetical protein FJT64_019190 [Amphibalanus amphitrite]|uniref:Uncharacterized protein n=1 Tax=Amphibalanus amphitrite TaxID=1232801 RepID=A0A6A4X5R2_AMPAM|nr:hypothetical protein FJT64_019190 [Amphibalanus amphitrite]
MSFYSHTGKLEVFHSTSNAYTPKVEFFGQLTKKLWKRAHCVSDCKQWYKLDQIHINPEGFRKMAAAEGLPSWIRFHDGA